MKQVLLPLLSHKGKLHNWQVRTSVQIQNLGVSFSKTTWCFHWATQEKKNIAIFVFLLQTRTDLFSSEKSFLHTVVY